MKGETTVVYLGLGGNQGDRLAHLRRAVQEVEALDEVLVLAVSPVFETQFVGPGRQEPYLNACLEMRTSLAPTRLLAALKAIEVASGRQPDGHMQPRPVDLDILLWGQEILDLPGLAVPHPRMRERSFVLEPLARLAGEQKFPDSGETVASACAKIRRKSDPWVKVRPQWKLQPDPAGRFP